MVKLGEYDCIGFDLDHTVIQYKLSNLYPLVYKCFAVHLVEEKGYDRCLLEDDFENYKDFCLRGLILDTHKGNILKIRKDGFILRASHGTKPMNREEIKECYGETQVWSQYTTLCKKGFLYPDYMAFENYFNLPVAVISARVVDIIDRKNGRQEKYNFWPDVRSGFMPVFNPANFAARKGSYFPTIIANPEKYIKPCSVEVINWMRSLRCSQQKILLLTNSFIDYAEFLLNYAVGKDWRDIFDIVVCCAGKPGFFSPVTPTSSKPFYELDGHKESHQVQHPDKDKIYSQGNHQDFMKCLIKFTGKDNPKVLYFGDSLKCDLYPSAVLGKWDVALLLEEMEVEGFEMLDDQQDKDEGPRRKRPKPLEFPIEDGKEDVLLSDRWGSLFTDSHNPSHDERVTDGSVADGSVIVTDGIKTGHTGRRELNTFWGDLIQKHSTIAIPRIDFIADLPKDHDFKTFGSLTWGFYPGPPKSVCLN